MAAAHTRIRWDRLGRWALLFVLALVLYLYIGPTTNWVSTWREAGEKRGEVAELRAENERLRARRDALKRHSVARARGAPARHGARPASACTSSRACRSPLASLGAVPFDTASGPVGRGPAPPRGGPRRAAPALERVTRQIEAELRRRLGGPFTSQELADLYDAGTGWTSDLAYALAPEQPYAWDVRVVGDAAFARYLREATDYAGRPRRSFACQASLTSSKLAFGDVTGGLRVNSATRRRSRSPAARRASAASRRRRP